MILLNISSSIINLERNYVFIPSLRDRKGPDGIPPPSECSGVLATEWLSNRDRPRTGLT
jgi:hypothetical protein